MHEGVTYIGEYAFSGCKSLRNLSIPDGVTVIQDCTFTSCEMLDNVKLPKNLVSIKPNAICRVW